MPGRVISPYEQVPVTKADLDWAELVTLDLSSFDQPGRKEELVKQLEHAVRHVGFFYVKNFNISQEEVDRQLALGREFYDLPLEEKLKYHNLAELESGEYNGYRPAGLRKCYGQHTGVQHSEVRRLSHPTASPSVARQHQNNRGVQPEMPQGSRCKAPPPVRDSARASRRRSAARSAEENKKVGELYTPGHTDLGSVSLLFRQPVAALQILSNERNWKWVKPQDATITINTCDALTALTGGYIESSVHRVRTPPEDQAHIDRLGVLYFARPNNHVVLDPLNDSPVLDKLGLTTNQFTELGEHLTMEEWVKKR
ncbi:hypothetical protein M8818_005297 [Zalaria obscura]|uniref:Uncharacterized protein n=1 Tax=Zalaria obscura TaxID=2024903 RepID=A0ACC3SAB2_9PEZI